MINFMAISLVILLTQSAWQYRPGQHELIKIVSGEPGQCGDYFMVRKMPSDLQLFFFYITEKNGKKGQAFDVKYRGDVEPLLDDTKLVPTIEVPFKPGMRGAILRIARKDYEKARHCLKPPKQP